VRRSPRNDLRIDFLKPIKCTAFGLIETFPGGFDDCLAQRFQKLACPTGHQAELRCGLKESEALLKPLLY
jgi:hypothetical protein